MNKTIFKYPLHDPKNINKVLMPKGAEILTIQTQHDNPCIWALVNPDPDVEKEERFFEVFGTGHKVPCDMGVERKYINTFQMMGGNLVFHLFERIN